MARATYGQMRYGSVMAAEQAREMAAAIADGKRPMA
jgi:hypothetical protein